MPPAFQIAIDCHDPHRLVRLWAAAMDLEVEDHDAQIRELLAAGIATDDDVTEVDGLLVWTTAAACRSEDRRTRLLFQTVPAHRSAGADDAQLTDRGRSR